MTTPEKTGLYAWQAFHAMSLLASSREQLGATDATEKHEAASRLAESILAEGLCTGQRTEHLRRAAVEHALRAGHMQRARTLAGRYGVEPSVGSVLREDDTDEGLLNLIVTKVIFTAERMDDEDDPAAALFYRDLSRYEELLADATPHDVDRTFAQRGAVMAARKARMDAREHALARRYAPLFAAPADAIQAPDATPQEQRRLRASLLVLLTTMAAWPCVASLLNPSLSDVMAGVVCTFPAVALFAALWLLGRRR